jgi:regulator of replication initiation timing
MLQQSTIEFYKDHLKRVIKDIRSDYEHLADEQIKTMRDWMIKKTEDLKLKYSQPVTSHEAYFEVENINGLKANLIETSKEINELKNTNKQLLKRLNELEEHAEMENNRINETIYQQNIEINKLNDDINELTNDCFHLDSYKATHDSELQVYKRLVDTEIKRLNENSNNENSNNENFSVSVFEGKVKNRKEISGDIGIDEVSPNGQYILIRNYGSTTTVNLTGWSLRRKLGNASTIEYNFPNDTHLMPNKFIRIWGSLFYPKDSLDECDILNTDIESWGFGVSTETNLLNTNLDSVSVFNQSIDFERY